FVEGGTAEVVHGLDDFRKPDIQNNSSSYQASNLASSYKNQVNYYDSNSSSGSYITDYAGGYMVMRYFIKQSKLSKSSTSRMIAAEDVGDAFVLDEDEGDVISVRLDDTGANALVTTDTGTVTVEGGANRLLNIVDGDGVKATYLAEAGLDGSMANEQGVSLNNDHLVASAVQQDVTPDKEYTYLDLNSPAFGQEVNTLNASGSQEDHLVLYGRYNQADLLLGANNGTTVFDGYGGNDTLCGGQGIDIFYWRPQTQGHDCTGDTTIISYTSGQDAIQFFGASSGASVSGYTVSGDDVILYNSQNNATFTVKDVSVDELTIVDAEGKELTAWKQGTSAVATLPDDETTESSAYLTESDSQAEQAMRNPNIFTSESGTETAVAFLPANANEKIFSADVLAAYSGTEEKNQQQNSSVTAC
ncbi:MAG: hypothetical protein IKO94_11530, partial [Selenomonadaceae bacterium]|nr:hypothetical protein [Selenomonadaceae bacterium]